jgi:hypothetical protein
MDVFALRAFSRRARKLGISDPILMSAVARIERGTIDAHLGSGLIKQRIERPGRGRTKSARSIIFLRQSHLIVFIHIFLKSDQPNLEPRELEGLRNFANEIAELGAEDIRKLVAIGEWRRIE